MTKKTRLIPFDWDKYKAGAKAVCSNQENKVLGIFIHKDNDEFLLVYEKEKNNCEWCLLKKDGKYYDYNTHEKNVLLEEEIEENIFYVNVYNNGQYTAHFTEHLCDLNACGRKGKLKVTYTDEDLIK